ncbi:MAG: hypothetical protein JXA96_02695 [Sedimentisphaerales bacterium]|nr:hypothetical protein [Sedimentisphaerales bacterium]
MSSVYSRYFWVISLLITVCLINFPAQAQYSGGTGEPNNPYQISEPNDWIELMNNSDDWEYEFVLTADIDLNGISLTPVGTSSYSAFTGIFEGNNYVIYNADMNQASSDYVGIFGLLGPDAKVMNLGIVDASISCSGDYIGALTGYNKGGIITNCYSTGRVSGGNNVGGLVGDNSGNISTSYSTSTVNGKDAVGGLVGYNSGNISTSYSTSTVSGDYGIGGLIGFTYGNIINCYASGSAKGQSSVGGLCGYLQSSNVVNCYATGLVSIVSNATGGRVVIHAGGLIGMNYSSDIHASFWDIETSGVSEGIGKKASDPNEVAGKTTEQMWTLSTFTDVGWDFADETVNGANDIWKIFDGLDSPHFWYEEYGGGSGEPNDPFRIATVDNLLLLSESPDYYNKHFILIDDINLDPNLPGRKVFDRAVIAPDTNDMEPLFQGNTFTGVFNGNGHKISHLTIAGNGYLGLFGQLGGEIMNLGVEEVDIIASDFFAGSIAGYIDQGSLIACYSSGIVSGEADIGGLVGDNDGTVTQCYSTTTVCGNTVVGGLTGCNLNVLYHCYSTGKVTGNSSVGGLLGLNIGDVNNCFWDIQTSGQINSIAGTGKTTSEMKNKSTFTSAGWDFFGEIINGTNEIWWINEGKEYPKFFDGEKASNPSPEDEAEVYDCTEIQLKWKSGLKGAVYNVYFGTNMNDVNLADVNNTFGVLYSQNQPGTSIDVVSLDYFNTYYWRIDEVKDGIIIIGDVWHFTLRESRKARCFTGQTRVWSDGKLIPFSNISKEQLIKGIGCLNQIKEVQIHEGTFNCYDVLLESGDCITVADNHYFKIENDQWVALKKLEAGTKLKSAKGLIEIKSIIKRLNPYTGKVYNLKIADSDYYFVGDDGIIARDY